MIVVFQLGYVEKNAQEKLQMCPGDPPGVDLSKFQLLTFLILM
jgi:hypothetical protein